jgi:tetratricopeptide (TPR) repeat protein
MGVGGRVRSSCGLLLLVSAAASGCAAHSQQTSSNRFVKFGKPLVEIGKPVKIQKAHGDANARRAVADEPPASNATLAPTIEASDPALSAALLTLSIVPTAEGHRIVAARYRELGILDTAYDHFLRASQLDHADAAAYEGLARIWRDWGFPQLGLADASRAVFYAPASASAHNTLGTLQAALGHDSDARREYQRTVELDPGAAYALNNLCYLSFLAGDASRALGECRAALAVEPGLTAARDTIASLERREARDRAR